MNFSVVLIARNESKTLPRLKDSLTEFQSRGGEVVLVDTGSSDGTAALARSYGFKVTEVGAKYLHTITENEARQINEKFVVGGEAPIVKAGETYFDFASARNFASSLASKNMICSMDADEAFTKLDIDAICRFIDEGFTQFEYNFVFAHDQYGNEAIKFVQSKFHDRRYLKWVGVIHEVLAGIGQIKFLGEDVFKLEHWQNKETNRSGYLRGLAVDCFNNPTNDRNSHYFARELMWEGRPKSAMKEFSRHIAMDKWPMERAQSMIYVGDCFGKINDPLKQAEWYHKAFHFDPSRREPLIKLARFYEFNKKYQAAAAYAAAALEIPLVHYYANQQSHYTNEPHEILYRAKGWLGDLTGARHHLFKALQYQPFNPEYQRDIAYYYPKVSFVIPTLGRPEGLKRVLESIDKLIYPESLKEVIVIEDSPRIGVPKRVKEGAEKATGEWIVFASNDMEFAPDAIINALQEKTALVAFNSGLLLPDHGNICEHFMIRKDFIPHIGGEIFDTEFHHVGVDNLLWAKCSKLEQASRAKNAHVIHHHFSRGMVPVDEVYREGWSHVESDRALLKQKLLELERA